MCACARERSRAVQERERERERVPVVPVASPSLTRLSYSWGGSKTFAHALTGAVRSMLEGDNERFTVLKLLCTKP